MDRRSFFRALGIGAGSVAFAPLLKLVPAPAVIACRKMIARIRITSGAIEDSQYCNRAFSRFITEEYQRVFADIQKREEARLVYDARDNTFLFPNRPLYPTQTALFDDSELMDEDY